MVDVSYLLAQNHTVLVSRVIYTLSKVNADCARACYTAVVSKPGGATGVRLGERDLGVNGAGVSL